LSLLSTALDRPTSQVYPMNLASIDDIRQSGFNGFVTVAARSGIEVLRSAKQARCRHRDRTSGHH
jgi:hypothetical protein